MQALFSHLSAVSEKHALHITFRQLALTTFCAGLDDDTVLFHIFEPTCKYPRVVESSPVQHILEQKSYTLERRQQLGQNLLVHFEVGLVAQVCIRAEAVHSQDLVKLVAVLQTVGSRKG